MSNLCKNKIKKRLCFLLSPYDSDDSDSLVTQVPAAVKPQAG
ncbi:MAG: hypothetical protein ACI94D_002493 [Neolewinella sp.]|jgi:hypothetical protein